MLCVVIFEALDAKLYLPDENSPPSFLALPLLHCHYWQTLEKERREMEIRYTPILILFVFSQN